MNYLNLTEHILSLSEEKIDFSKASQEWSIYSIEDTKSNDNSCPCVKQNIRYLCYIQNTITNEITFVGNECIKRFPKGDEIEVEENSGEKYVFNIGEIVKIASKSLSLNGSYYGLDKYNRIMFEINRNSKIIKSKKSFESYFLYTNFM